MCLDIVCKYVTSRYDMYYMTDMTAGNLDSEELLVLFVLSLAFLGVPVLQCVIKLIFGEEKNWKVTKYWGFGYSKAFYGF